MSRKVEISRAFADGKAFIGFLTAGDPDIETTKTLILEMERAGADLIEIGIPFSDPVAEGVVIQEADIRALASGTTTDMIFDMVDEIRDQVKVPLVFMTYVNPIFHYGYERFCERCREVGIAGVIVPDLPFEEKNEFAGICREHDMNLISMIAPTSDERIKQIASEAEGFLYVVSSMGVTGVRSKIETDIGAMVEKVRAASDIPAAIGFGISTPEQAAEMSRLSDGAIVGSAIVRIIAREGRNAAPAVYEYVKSMKDAVRAL
ncbi:MAG: tryptophan synthase subunit alpha [Clostridia bacterium]|nr:tryptophan synthase subunit alpha [Clostridia bacterium]